MPTVTLEDKGCRGCTMCVDICAVDVFELDDATEQAKVTHSEDCIGCLSCTYLCPSECITVSDVELIRPFHRSDESGALVEKFLQSKMPSREISPDDWKTAQGEVALLLTAFSDALTEVIGRGHKAVGRRAGTVAAAHLPEMYEESSLDQVLARMASRFGQSFRFDHQIAGDEINLDIPSCGMHDVVEGVGGKVGDHILCQLFHEYWTGLVSAYAGSKYMCEVPQAGASCKMTLKPQQRG